MSTDLGLDIRELVGELPVLPCEQPEHETAPYHGGAATHYVRILHSCVSQPGSIQAICEPLTTFLRERLSHTAHCSVCKFSGVWADFVTIIGPIWTMP